MGLNDSQVGESIRRALTDHAKLRVPVTAITDTDNLYDLGLNSHASVNVMLAIEDALDVEFPDELLRKSTFESIDSICVALAQIDGS